MNSRAPIIALVVLLPFTVLAATPRTPKTAVQRVAVRAQVARRALSQSRAVPRIFKMALKPRQSKAQKAQTEVESLSARLADHVASFAGSWTFISSFSIGMAAWMAYNTYSAHPFDAAPFVGLNLILSTVAALQAPFILMSSNRQADKDRKRAEADHVLNVQAEQEVVALHGKIETLSEDVRLLTAALAAQHKQ